MNEEKINKLCPLTAFKDYCIKEDCALYSEEYNGCCIANFGEEMSKSLLAVLRVSRMTRRK